MKANCSATASSIVLDPFYKRFKSRLRPCATGAGIWLFLSTLVAIGVGAFVSGRTAPDRGGLHGLLTWTVTTLLKTWLLLALPQAWLVAEQKARRIPTA
jgi:hypothetical protein